MFPLPTLESVRSCWQVPYIAYFCSLFNKYLDIPTFDTEDLELALLQDPTKKDLLPELITRLLRKCDFTRNAAEYIGINTFDTFLEKVFHSEFRRLSPYTNNCYFDEFPVDVKIRTIQQLIDIRFESEDIQKIVETANPDSLRILPLGYDSSASAYYYFFGTRLYKESNAVVSSLQLNGSTTNGNTSDADISSTLNSSLGNSYLNPVKWELVCETEEDWIELTNSLAKSIKTKPERALVKILEENFLPNISSLFKKKQKEEQLEINKYIPRRSSNRIKVLAEVKSNEVKQSKINKYLAKPVNFDRAFKIYRDRIYLRKGCPKPESEKDFSSEEENESSLKKLAFERSERAKKRSQP